MTTSGLIPAQRVASAILVVRGQRVILDEDLAALYGVDTKSLNRAVKRNADRFPERFCFRLTDVEWAALRYQFGTAKGRGGRTNAPYAFTEHGVIAAAFVLNSAPAVQVSVQVVEAFVRIRQFLASNEDLARKVGSLDRRTSANEAELRNLSAAFRKIAEPPTRPARPRVGFLEDDGAGPTEQSRRRPRTRAPRGRG